MQTSKFGHTYWLLPTLYSGCCFIFLRSVIILTTVSFCCFLYKRFLDWICIFAVPPMGAKITPPKPEELKAGSMTKLTCEIGSSNPEPTVSWWVDGIEVKDGVTKSCKSGLYGGKVCVTELSLNLTSDMDGQRYICQAVNEPLGKSATSFIILNVHCKLLVINQIIAERKALLF